MSLGPEFVFAWIAWLGLPVIAIGVVLRLVEWGSEKPRWSLGSAFFLAVGVLLCLPLLLWIVLGIAVWLAR